MLLERKHHEALVIISRFERRIVKIGQTYREKYSKQSRSGNNEINEYNYCTFQGTLNKMHACNASIRVLAFCRNIRARAYSISAYVRVQSGLH